MSKEKENQGMDELEPSQILEKLRESRQVQILVDAQKSYRQGKGMLQDSEPTEETEIHNALYWAMKDNAEIVHTICKEAGLTWQALQVWLER